MSYDEFFARAMGLPDAVPYGYQRRLAVGEWPEVLIAPTGLGKTAAVVLGWLWRRATDTAGTPRRLVLCLPMRTLVEQTAAAVRGWLGNLEGAASDGVLPHPDDGLAILMGGMERHGGIPPWAMHPERPAILIGTQDMLLSRALMRGYGMSRFRWPVDFALLHTDAQWVFDEVQAMGAGLATSAQLQGLRATLGTACRTRTLWVSATLEPDWLRTVDHGVPTSVLRVPDDVPEDGADPRVRRLLDAGKRLSRAAAAPTGTGAKDTDAYAVALVREVLDAHRPGRTTLVILNTVARAQALWSALSRTPEGRAIEPMLVHSRFRPAERHALANRLRAGDAPGDRIIVATQAIEAGVDITAAVLFTELAPWSSLVQRFGRVNRYGECGADGADIRWIDVADAKGGLARPYTPAELDAARDTLSALADADAAPARLPPPSAPPPVGHALRRKDLLDLFDTDPDLTGFDLDVSPFIRDAQDTDFQVFWRRIGPDAPAAVQPLPRPEELCAVPIGRAGELLPKGRPAWRLDPQSTVVRGGPPAWTRLDGNRAWPGLVVMLDAAGGGYDPVLGLLPGSTRAVPELPVSVAPDDPGVQAAEAHDDEADTRRDRAIPLPAHLARVAAEAADLCDRLHIVGAARRVVTTAARWHDVGKAHSAFQARLVKPPELAGDALAKAPGYDRTKGRPYLRHELASALAFLRVHEGEDGADLAAYLIAAHHGKVRLSLRALPVETGPPGGGRFARGIHEGDPLPAVDLGDGNQCPAVTLSLALMELGDGEHGPSWTTRTDRLLHDPDLGPFRLAWLEALVRIADWRASEAEQREGDGDDGR